MSLSQRASLHAYACGSAVEARARSHPLMPLSPNRGVQSDNRKEDGTHATIAGSGTQRPPGVAVYFVLSAVLYAGAADPAMSGITLNCPQAPAPLSLSLSLSLTR